MIRQIFQIFRSVDWRFNSNQFYSFLDVNKHSSSAPSTRGSSTKDGNITIMHPLQRPPPQANPNIECRGSDEEEVEELFVDDFDGQCSRTYPDNHSKIIRWRASKNQERNAIHAGNGTFEEHTISSNLKSFPRDKEMTSDIRCKDWSKIGSSVRRPLDNGAHNSGTDAKTIGSQISAPFDGENDFAKKRRLNLDSTKPTSTLTTESNSTGMENIGQ